MAGSNSFSLTILFQRFNALKRMKTVGSHWKGTSTGPYLNLTLAGNSNLKKLGDGK